MQNFSTTPRSMANSFWQNRGLIFSLVRRDVVGRYRGSVLGILWSFFNPVFMLAVYTFVFSVVFQARWDTGSGSRSEFALVLFAGLMLFNLFSECIARAPSLILQNSSYVKKVVFPLEILPMVSLGSALFHFAISLGVWFIFYAFIFGMPHLTALIFPIVLAPFILLIMGFSWFLASLGVYLRDVTQIIGIITTALMFLTPIFYPLSAIPEAYRIFVYLNPLTFIVEQGRDLLFFGHAPSWQGLLSSLSCR